jgi:hypothetical protein
VTTGSPIEDKPNVTVVVLMQNPGAEPTPPGTWDLIYDRVMPMEMLDRFTEPARQAIVRAIEEARTRGHAEVGPAHLLLALHRSDILDRDVLRRIGISVEALEAQAKRTLAAIPSVAASGDPVFSSALRDVFGALLKLGYPIGPEGLWWRLIGPRSRNHIRKARIGPFAGG